MRGSRLPIGDAGAGGTIGAMQSPRQRLGVLHAFDADLTREQIEERWGIVLELGELICESTENGGRRLQVFMVFIR